MEGKEAMNSTQQTILIVEDMQLSQQYLKDTLQKDYNILCAESGEQALDIIKSQKIDLVLLDIIMPDMDGYELCSLLKLNPDTKDIPIIFISIKDKPQDQVVGFALGANDYLPKTTHPIVLKARVKHHLEQKKRWDMLVKLSFIDALTGIANRRYFDETFKKLWNHTLRNKGFLSILLIDIDFFKEYNDFYGHLAGDKCLRKVANAIKISLSRSCDIAARYGGEEFVVLLPLTARDGAIQIANKIQGNIGLLQIQHRLSDISSFLTVSIGIATIRPKEKFDPSLFIKRADYGLYKAKKEGRNRFIAIE